MASNRSFDDATVVATYSTLYEAELAQSHLDENEIDSFIVRDDSGGMDPHMQLTRGVRLVVRSGQAVKARQILEWMDAVPHKEFSIDDAEYDAQRLKMWRQLGTALLVLGAGTLLLALGLWMDGAGGAVPVAGGGVLMVVVGAVSRWAVDRSRTAPRPHRHAK